jgi:hypothetical protein
MQPHPLPGIPPIGETQYSRESLVHALSHEATLPSTEIAAATLYAEELEPDFLAVIERAATEELDLPSWRLFFRGLHILGGRRLSSAYRPVVALLRGPQHRVENLLGDAVTETLSNILAGLFDGDPQPLSGLISDSTVDPFVRAAALGALTFLTFDKRIDRQAFERFLRSLDDNQQIPRDDDVVWHTWMTAIGMLGVTGLVPRVRAAFADGRISSDVCDEEDFDRLLRDAIEQPEDTARFADKQMGYIEDVLMALETFDTGDEHDAGDEDHVPFRAAPDLPAYNPFRRVGRNDPCPCGSGKKFKKCCLQ